MMNQKPRMTKYPLDRIYYISLSGFEHAAISYETGRQTGYRILGYETVHYKVKVIA